MVDPSACNTNKEKNKAVFFFISLKVLLFYFSMKTYVMGTL